MRFNAFYSEDLPAWLPGCLLLPSYPSFLPATIALTPSLHLPLSFARRASPAFHPSASQPSFLSAFQIDGFTKEGQRGRTEETDRYIYIYIYIDIHVYWEKEKRKKKKKETWKTSGTFVSFMPNLYSRPKERFRIFFSPTSPSQPNHRSTGQNSRWNSRGQDMAVDVHARDIHRRRMRKKSAGWFARVDCVDSWIQIGKGEGDAATEKSSSDFLNGDAWNSLSKSVGEQLGTEERDFRRESGTHKRYLLHLVNVTNVYIPHSLFVSLFRGFAKENSQGRNGVV